MNMLILRIIFLGLNVSAAVSSAGCFGGDSSTVSTVSSNSSTNNGVIVNNPLPVTSTIFVPVPTPPTVSGVVRLIYTRSATDISDTAATLHGELDASWVSTLEQAYFEVRRHGFTSWDYLIPIGHPGRRPFYAIAGLLPDTLYEVQLIALVGIGPEMVGGIERFMTMNSPPRSSDVPMPHTSSTVGVVVTTNYDVVTLPASEIATESVTINGRVDVPFTNGAAYVLLSTDVGVTWSHRDLGRPSGNFSSRLFGLLRNTEYSYKVIAVNGTEPAHTGANVWLRFRTLP
ncbi:MAG: hypothetical protein HZA94_01635 [Candidatus Vogelbacteria bacterium]|nr:hypothetical protein [Candidatus Vogelbacteria bacterium]